MNRLVVNDFPVILAKKRLRISKVSRDTGISRTTLTKLYYSENARISIQTLEKLCDYLDCSIEDIIGTSKAVT